MLEEREREGERERERERERGVRSVGILTLKRFDTLGIIASLVARGRGGEEGGRWREMQPNRALVPNVTGPDPLKGKVRNVAPASPALDGPAPNAFTKGKPGTEGWRAEGRWWWWWWWWGGGGGGVVLTSQCHMSILHRNKSSRVH